MITVARNEYTQVTATDEIGSGNAHHRYTVERYSPGGGSMLTLIEFQDGPIKEAGVNGCTNEDLLAIVAHRISCFQDGPFQCLENAHALTKVLEALHWLGHRTAAREARGVEGTNTV